MSFFTDQSLFHYSLLSLLLSSPISFLSLQFISAPYGKHRRNGWGPNIYPPIAWFLMEGPTLWVSIIIFPMGRNRVEPKAIFLFFPFIIHYLNRTVIYPIRIHRKNKQRKTANRKTTDRVTAFDQGTDDQQTEEYRIGGVERKTIDKEHDDQTTAYFKSASRKTADQKTACRKTTNRKTSYSEIDEKETDDKKTAYRKTASGFPASVALMAFTYNIWNTYLQARWVSHYADFETDGWFWWRFFIGMVVFFTGMAVNIWADLVLLQLKGEGGSYRVPKGGLFEFVSCPNYFGEVVEWLGWAVMTWSWAGVGFFLFTCSNLVPRAHSHHKWYLEKFGEDYPKSRKAVIPFLY